MAVRFSTIHRWDFFRALQLLPFDNKTDSALTEANSQQSIANRLNLRPTRLSGVGLVYADNRAVVLHVGVPGGGDGECGAAGGGVDVEREVVVGSREERGAK